VGSCLPIPWQLEMPVPFPVLEHCSSRCCKWNVLCNRSTRLLLKHKPQAQVCACACDTGYMLKARSLLFCHFPSKQPSQEQPIF
jgi:hypothetical protein